MVSTVNLDMTRGHFPIQDTSWATKKQGPDVCELSDVIWKNEENTNSDSCRQTPHALIQVSSVPDDE